jgi:hypothetical protein
MAIASSTVSGAPDRLTTAADDGVASRRPTKNSANDPPLIANVTSMTCHSRAGLGRNHGNSASNTTSERSEAYHSGGTPMPPTTSRLTIVLHAHTRQIAARRRKLRGGIRRAYHIARGGPLTNGAPRPSCRAWPTNACFPRAVVRVAPAAEGEDAAQFLQGLVTNDVTAALPVYAALLTAQGKACSISSSGREATDRCCSTARPTRPATWSSASRSTGCGASFRSKPLRNSGSTGRPNWATEVRPTAAGRPRATLGRDGLG